ncbi:hypothetical protein [Bdellovibrio sp. HCB337]|uniref:hypothetical protein n=1 Tax=Bdellovibrio sp. HCB337 TaxID=3394358 RepID=UPI0039A58DDE
MNLSLKICTLGLIVFTTLPAFANISEQENHAIKSACDLVNTDSLARLLCWRQGIEQVEDNTPIEEAVAGICNDLVNIQSDVPYFLKCFKTALPQAQVPQGYPHFISSLCERLTEQRKSYTPGTKLQKLILCDAGPHHEAGVAMRNICVSLWKDADGIARMQYRTAEISMHKPSHFYSPEGLIYNLQTKKMEGPGDQRVYSGKVVKMDSKMIEFNTRLDQSWSKDEITTYSLDLKRGQLSVDSCQKGLASCKKIYSHKYSCNVLK